MAECECGCGQEVSKGRRFRQGHYAKTKQNGMTDILARLVICEPRRLETGCWEWAGFKDKGYGKASIGGRLRKVHEIVYSHFVGPVPKGRELHHRCENPSCANWEHLEPLTHREHILKGSRNFAARHAVKTHCPHGHEYTEANTRTYKGMRFCRACRRLWGDRPRRKGDS